MQIFVEKIRNEKNLSMSELAKLAGISKSTLYDIESGQSDPKLSTLCKISEALDVPCEKLFSCK